MLVVELPNGAPVIPAWLIVPGAVPLVPVDDGRESTVAFVELPGSVPVPWTPVDRAEMLTEELAYAVDVVLAILIVPGAVERPDAPTPIELLLVLVGVGNGGKR